MRITGEVMTKLCNVPFCENTRNRNHGLCATHRWEKDKRNIKTYKELLPIWCLKRCNVHGLLRADQTYKNPSHKGFVCKQCISDKRPPYSAEHYKKYHNRYLTRCKNWQLQKEYGISLDDYNQMLINQNHECAICSDKYPKTINGKLKNLHVDHCHTTGQIRGLLCFNCNSTLGRFNDDINIFQSAIDYLAYHLDRQE
jgi:hypothetical protein